MDESGAISNIVDLEAHKKTSRIHVTNAILQELADLIPSMTSLNINGCFEVTDTGLWALSRTCTQIAELRMSGLPYITHVGLRSIVTVLKERLRVLDLSHCPGINDEAVNAIAASAWGLEVINLSDTEAGDSSVDALAGCCRHLKSVNFTGNKKIGDHALKKIARYCTGLTKLSVCDTRYVKGEGLRAVAERCPALTSLNLSGCDAMTDEDVFTHMERCTGVTELHLSGCKALGNKGMRTMAMAMRGLLRLDVTNCPRLGHRSFAAIAKYCGSLAQLKAVDLVNVKSKAIASVAEHCTALKSLDLSGCRNLKARDVTLLTTKLTRLTTLKLNRCSERLGITREYVNNLASRLEYVQAAKDFFGLVGLPDSEARIYLTELRQAQVYAVIQCQRIVRGRLARNTVAEMLRQLKMWNAALKIQSAWRGHVARTSVKDFRRVLTEDEAVMMMQNCVRGWFGRLNVRRLRWRLRMEARRNQAATVLQAGIKGYWARCLRHRLMDAKFLREQAARRLAIKRVKCAKIIQGGFRIYRARCRILAMKEAIRRAKALHARQVAASIQMQRLVRAHLARQQYRAMKAYVAMMIRQAKAALFMQTSCRRFLAKMEANRRRWQRNIKRRWEAAIKIQKAFRGSRGRHVFAVLLSLQALRAVEEAAAVKIQTKYRMYRARYFLWTVREGQRHQRFLDDTARTIQKAFRGLKGRQFFEVVRNQMAVKSIAGPLQDELLALETEELEYKKEYKTLEGRLEGQRKQVVLWSDECRKLEMWRDKEYDTDKLTGTMQRFKVEFLKDALVTQLHTFHSNLKYLEEALVVATFNVHDTGRRLRMKRRELRPLMAGIRAKTMQQRRQRLRDWKKLQHDSAAIIQGLVRGRQTRRKLRMGLIPAPEVEEPEATAEGEDPEAVPMMVDDGMEVTDWAAAEWEGYNEEWQQEGQGEGEWQEGADGYYNEAGQGGAGEVEDPYRYETDEYGRPLVKPHVPQHVTPAQEAAMTTQEWEGTAEAQPYGWTAEQWDPYWGQYGADVEWTGPGYGSVAGDDDYTQTTDYGSEAGAGAGGYDQTGGGYEGYDGYGGYDGYDQTGGSYDETGGPLALEDGVTSPGGGGGGTVASSVAGSSVPGTPMAATGGGGGADSPAAGSFRTAGSGGDDSPAVPKLEFPAGSAGGSVAGSAAGSVPGTPGSTALARAPAKTAAAAAAAATEPEQDTLYPVKSQPKKGFVKGKGRRLKADETPREELLELSPRMPVAPSLYEAAGPRPEDSCVVREKDTGLPSAHIPRLLRHKLATIDREAYPYQNRRTHIAFLQFKTAAKEWVLVGGIADQIIASQRKTRQRKEDETRKAAEDAAEAARLHAITRRQEDLLGMHVADEESRKAQNAWYAFLKREAARQAREDADRLAKERNQMQREHDLSMRVDLVYRQVLAEQARVEALSHAKANRKRDRKAMVAAARESRAANDDWQEEYRQIAAYNRMIGEMESDLMDSEEQESLIMNRVWQRIGRAKDFTRKRQKQIARREARIAAGQDPDDTEEEEEGRGGGGGGGAAASERKGKEDGDGDSDDDDSGPTMVVNSIPGETEEQAERRAIREYLRLKGVDVPDSETEAGGLAVSDDDEADDLEFDNQVSAGRNGWVSLETEDGYLYYFHGATDTTQWERPDDF